MVKCKGCGSESFDNYLNCNQIDLQQCRRCKLIFISDIPSDSIITNYYQDAFYDKEKSKRFIKPFEVILALTRYFRVLAIQQFCKCPGKMIDVGFSRGITMRMLKSKGWQTFGTQISLNAYKNAKTSGLDVFLGDLKSARLAPESADLITFWHVIEHVKDPDNYFKEANRILKKNGKLIVEVPNIGSPLAKLFRKKWFALDLPRHLYHYSTKSLNFILEKNGFYVVKRIFFSLEQSIFTLLQSILNLFNYKNNVFFGILKKNRKMDFFSTTYNYFLLAIFLIPSIILSWLFGVFRFGDIMRFYCIKVEDVANSPN